MGKVASLVPASVKKHQGVITTLENFAVVVEKESLTGIAIAAVDAQGCTHTAFESGENIATLLGAIARLQRRLLDLDAPG